MSQIADALFHNLCTGYLHDGYIENDSYDDFYHHAKEHAGKHAGYEISYGAGC